MTGKVWALTAPLLAILLWVVPAKAESPAEPRSPVWSYVFFIAGDYYTQGATRLPDGRLVDEDQARRLYQELTRLARADSRNQYTIFYDPRGRATFFSDRHVRLDVYRAGKQVHDNGIFETEVDSTRPETVSRVIRESERFANPGDYRAFFYYGEHLAPRPIQILQDFSAPNAPSLAIEGIAQALSLSGRSWDLLAFQSCDLHSRFTLQNLTPLTSRLILPQGLISRLLGRFDFLLQSGTPEELASRWAHGADQEHPYRDWGSKNDRSELLSALSRLEALSDPELLRSLKESLVTLIRNTAKTPGKTDERIELEALPSPVTLLRTGEILIKGPDYLQILEQTRPAMSPEAQKALQTLEGNGPSGRLFQDLTVHLAIP